MVVAQILLQQVFWTHSSCPEQPLYRECVWALFLLENWARKAIFRTASDFADNDGNSTIRQSTGIFPGSCGPAGTSRRRSPARRPCCWRPYRKWRIGAACSWWAGGGPIVRIVAIRVATTTTNCRVLPKCIFIVVSWFASRKLLKVVKTATTGSVLVLTRTMAATEHNNQQPATSNENRFDTRLLHRQCATTDRIAGYYNWIIDKTPWSVPPWSISIWLYLLVVVCFCKVAKIEIMN